MNAETFNARYPVGTPVFAYPGAHPEDVRNARRLVTRTRSRASVLGGHTDVVWVDGHSACIALSHVDVVPEVAEWKLTRDNLAEIDDQVDADGVYAKGFWEFVDGKTTVTGLRIGTGETRIVARFGDTIVRHANGTYSVRPAASGAES